MNRLCRLVAVLGTAALTTGCASVSAPPEQAIGTKNFTSSQTDAGSLRADFRAFFSPLARGDQTKSCDGDKKCDVDLEIGIFRKPLEKGFEDFKDYIDYCYVLIPYSKIKVGPKCDLKDKKCDPNDDTTYRVQWNLKSVSTKDKIDEKDYVFCSNDGSSCNAYGIEFLLPRQGAPLPPGIPPEKFPPPKCEHINDRMLDFDHPGHGEDDHGSPQSGKRKFKWENRHKRQNVSFCHVPNVRPKTNGDLPKLLNHRCIAVDPLIFNQ